MKNTVLITGASSGIGQAAATDGTSQLRYFVGEDIGDLVKAKRELSDPDYVAFMRTRFLARD